ncbi:hypothetical protein LOTGIDRAFT_120388, partial [Lottia gigantea]
GYKRAFDQYAEAIHQRFPGITIEGGQYPAPSMRALIAQILSIAKLVIIGFVVSGHNPFTLLNIPTPSVYEWATQNKIYACLMVFFISNAIEGQLISTGAFEISFNDVPIWSKLETGRIPSPSEMFQILDNHMRLNNQS